MIKRFLCPSLSGAIAIISALVQSELKLPAARPVDELRSSRYGECARCSIFKGLVHKCT